MNERVASISGKFVSVALAAPAVYDYTAQSTATEWNQGVCASGTGQSPIDVDESNLTTVTDKFDKFTFVNYENPHKWEVQNTGHGVKIVPDVEEYYKQLSASLNLILA